MKKLIEIYEAIGSGLKTFKKFLDDGNLKKSAYVKFEVKDPTNKWEFMDAYKSGSTKLLVYKRKGDDEITVDINSDNKDVGFAVGNDIKVINELIKPYLK